MMAALIGAAVGVLTILLARFIRGERWVYAVGLLTLPSLYASFAVRVGDRTASVTEMLVGIPYLVAGVLFAVVGVRRSAIVVGALWLLHGLFDLVHDRFITNAGVPDGYPIFCFVVDAVIGVYVLWLARRLPEANLRRG